MLHEVAELMPRRGLVVLISDLFYAPDEVFSGLDHLRFHGHDLLVFHVLDPLEHGCRWRTGSLPRPGDGRGADHPGGGDPGGLHGGRRLLAAPSSIGDRAAAGIDRVALTSDMPLDRALFDYLTRLRRDVLNVLLGSGHRDERVWA